MAHFVAFAHQSAVRDAYEVRDVERRHGDTAASPASDYFPPPVRAVSIPKKAGESGRSDDAAELVSLCNRETVQGWAAPSVQTANGPSLAATRRMHALVHAAAIEQDSEPAQKFLSALVCCPRGAAWVSLWA